MPPPVFILGLHRSGTNALYAVVASAPEINGHNEDHPEAFENFRLRDAARLREIIHRSPDRITVFKSISDTLKWSVLRDEFPGSKIVFIVRQPLDLVLSYLFEFPAGEPTINRLLEHDFHRHGAWIFRNRAPLASVDRLLERYGGRFAASGDYPSKVALFWALCHLALEESGLFQAPDVLVVDYDSLVASPDRVCQQLESFLGVSLPAEARQIPRRTAEHLLTANVDLRMATDCLAIYGRLRTLT